LENAVPRAHKLLEIGGRATQLGELRTSLDVFLYVMILNGHPRVEKISPEVANTLAEFVFSKKTQGF
jgi:hypothetical protein